MTAGSVRVEASWRPHDEASSAPDCLWYFGRDLHRFFALTADEAWARAAERAGDAVNAAADRLRDVMINLDTLLASERFAQAWYASDLAERNPLVSDFFLNLCRAVALVEAAKRGGDHLVIIEDADLAAAMLQVLRAASVPAACSGFRTKPIRRLLRGVYAHLVFLRWLLRYWQVRRGRVRLAGLKNIEVLLISWWSEKRPGSSEENSQRDRYFGDLAQWLGDAGLRVAWLGAVPMGGQPIEPASRAAAASAPQPMVPLDSFFHLSGLLRGYLLLLSFPFAVKRRLVLEGIDLSPIVRWAVRRELSSPRLPTAVMYRDAASELKRAGFAPRAIAFPYENQPWEKMLVLGLRAELPKTAVIGIQHAPFATNYTCAFPSPRQWRDRCMPDRMFVMGEEFRRELVAAGAPPDRVVVAGALRFAAIPDAPTVDVNIRPLHDPRTVLATCPIDLTGTLELALIAARATAGLPATRLLVNFHPHLGPEARQAVTREVMALSDAGHVRFVEGDALVWLRQTDLLLYNSSATSFEATALGIPAIFVGSPFGLDLDKMHGADAPCRTAKSLRRAIVACLGDEDARRARVSTAVAYARRYVAPAHPAVWKSLFKDAARCD